MVSGEFTVTNEGNEVYTFSVVTGDGTSVEFTAPTSVLVEILTDLRKAVEDGENSTHTVTFLGASEVN